MKKSSIISIVFLFISTMAFADDVKNHQAEQVIMKGKNHFSQWDIPADMPDVYYDSELGVITIVDYANVTYYVTIYDDWWNAVITDTKPGGGTISASSLSSGDYVIEITTSWNHDYTGNFDTSK